jgi:hypothetical protein
MSARDVVEVALKDAELELRDIRDQIRREPLTGKNSMRHEAISQAINRVVEARCWVKLADPVS